jgi:hypothetical protein
MVSWGVLEGSFDPRTQINKAIEHEAHARAATACCHRDASASEALAFQAARSMAYQTTGTSGFIQ